MNILPKQTEFYINNSKAHDLDITRFTQFVKNLKASRKVKFIYRGESNLYEYYNTNLNNIPLLCQHIFMLGEKGRILMAKQISPKIIDDVFLFIWNRLHHKVCNLDFSNQRTAKYVSHFLKKNLEIIDYFSNEQNRKQFIAFSRHPIKEQRYIADYYISLLHTIGKSGISQSYFLSSSKQLATAEYFKNKELNGILLYGWVPRKGMKETTIDYSEIKKYSRNIELLGLPTYNTPMYPDQKEICLKGGLLPHFILGFKYDKRFYINPATLQPWNDNIPSTGMKIEQENFNHLLETSNYASSFLFYDGQYYTVTKNKICIF